MAERARRTFTLQFKAEVELAILSGRRSNTEICWQQSVKAELLSLCKKTLFLNLPGIFKGPTLDGDAMGGRGTVLTQAVLSAADHVVGLVTGGLTRTFADWPGDFRRGVRSTSKTNRLGLSPAKRVT